MVQYIVYPGRGGTPLEPQLFYNPDLVLGFAPFSQLDWPLPRGYEYHNQLRTLTQGPAPVVVSQLPLGSADGQNELWGIPVYTPYPIQLRTLINSPAPAFVQLPFSQTDWPNPTLRIRDTLGWTWSYNLNLIGKDQFPPGESVYQLPPRLVDTQVRTWLVSPKVPPTVAQNPFSQTDWPNPGTYLYPVQLRTLTEGPAPVFVAPFFQSDWPNPREFRDYRTWTWSYNQNLIGQDKFPPGESYFALPSRDPREYRTWIQSSPIVLTTVAVTLPPGRILTNIPLGPDYPVQLRTLVSSPAPVIAVLPFGQTNWPLTGDYQRGAQSWTWQYNLNLIGQDHFPVGEMITVLPPVGYPPQVPTLINSPAPTVPVVVFNGPFPQYDWPLSGRPALREYTWLHSPAVPPVVIVPLPYGKASTALPLGPDYPVQLRTLINSPAPVFVVAAQTPFNQTNWPLPSSYPRQLFDWASWYNLNLIGQDQFPIGENTTGGQNAQFGLILTSEYPIQLRTLTNAPYPVIAPIQLPFNQTDWPLPRTYLQPAQNWTYEYLLTLIGRDRLPVGEYVLWSLPYGAVYPVQSITENNIPLLTFVPIKLPPGAISTGLPGQPFYPSQIASITSGPAPVFVPGPPVLDLHFKPLLVTIGRMGHLGGLS